MVAVAGFTGARHQGGRAGNRPRPAGHEDPNHRQQPGGPHVGHTVRARQEAKDGKPIPSTVVTLLALPADAEKIALAATAGRLILVLRNPLDNAPTITVGAGLAGLTGSPAPPPTVVRASESRRVVKAPPPPPPQPYTVETIRAAKHAQEDHFK